MDVKHVSPDEAEKKRFVAHVRAADHHLYRLHQLMQARGIKTDDGNDDTPVETLRRGLLEIAEAMIGPHAGVRITLDLEVTPVGGRDQ